MEKDKMNRKELLKSVIGWIAGGIFLFWALIVFAMNNPIGGILTAIFALSLTTLRKKVFNKLNLNIRFKQLSIVIVCLFLTSCGATLALTETTSNDTADVVPIVAEENSQELENTQVETDIEFTEEIDSIVEKTIVEENLTEDIPIEPEEYIAEMQVHFIDVGQGDATLIMCDGEAMLIDAGDDSKGSTVWNYLSKQGVEKLNYLVLTHTDADHIGGADVIVTKFEIDNVFMGDFPKDNKVYNELIQALDDKMLNWSTPSVGDTYTLGSADFTIVAPNKEYMDPNNSSIALLVQNGENKFLFTGDAEEESEKDILENDFDIKCDVFHAGHHGSKDSNSQAFLMAAAPEFVVISCAEGNAYGHPHAEPLNNFRSMGIKVYRTDEQGSIVSISTGKEITWNCAPSDTWQAGENTENSSSESAETSKTESLTPPSESSQTIEESQEETVPVIVEPASGELVWKSATGKKYHSINNCGNMNPNKATQITKEEAERLGLTPCSKCY